MGKFLDEHIGAYMKSKHTVVKYVFLLLRSVFLYVNVFFVHEKLFFKAVFREYFRGKFKFS